MGFNNRLAHLIAHLMMDVATVRNTPLSVVGSRLYPLIDMIYSFLPENINAELGVKADKVFPRQHDYLEFYVEGNSLRVEEWVDEYGEATQMRTERIALKPGDHLIVNSIAGLTLLQLLKMKIKVSILSRELITLPPEQQTKDKICQLRYFLVSST